MAKVIRVPLSSQTQLYPMLAFDKISCCCLVGKLCQSETSWIVARQAPLSMGFSLQEYWSGLPFPPPGDLPDPGIEPGSPALQADSLPLSHQGSPWYEGA